MLRNLKNLVLDATWYLRSGVAPSKIDINNSDYLKNVNHMSSKKFAMTMVAIGVVAFMYFASVLLLFIFPADPHVSALVSMYKDMIVAIAAIAGTLVGIQGLVDWKHNSASSAELSSESVKQEIYEKKTNNAKEEDYEVDI